MSPGISADNARALLRCELAWGTRLGAELPDVTRGGFSRCAPAAPLHGLPTSRLPGETSPENGKGEIFAAVLVLATHPSCVLGQKNPSVDGQVINGQIISRLKSESPVLSPLGQHLRGARALLRWLLQIGAGA